MLLHQKVTIFIAYLSHKRLKVLFSTQKKAQPASLSAKEQSVKVALFAV